MNQNQQKVMRLLLTARGQMDAVIRMMEEGRYCVDISNQLLAIDALIRKANADVLSNHLRTCVKDSIVMQQTVIRSGSCVTRAIVDEDVTILEDAKIGGEEKITVIGSELTIPKGAEIKAGEMLYPRVK